MNEEKVTHKKHGLTVEVLKNLYLNELKSDVEIGKMFGLTDVAVSYYRRKYGITTLSSCDRFSEKAKRLGLQDIRNVSRERFIEIYESVGERGMAKVFGCSRIVIRRFRSKYGISSLNKSERINIKYPAVLTDEQRSVLFGSLLGDGGMACSECKTARYSEFHSLEQLDYLRWKQSVLLPFSGKTSRSDKLLEDGRIAYGNVFRTCFHSVFYSYWEMFYKSGEKRLPECFERVLDPLALAVWYTDDGHLADKTQDGVATIATGLPQEDLDRIEKHLNSLCLDVEIKTRPDISIVWIYNKVRFFEMVGKHIHPSMTYKIPVSLGGCRKSKDSVVLDGEKAVLDDKVDVELWTEKMFRFLRVAGFSYPYCPQETIKSSIKAVINSPLDLDKDIPMGYSRGSSECLSFVEGFWEAKRKGKKSAVEVFNDDAILRHAISDCIIHRKSVSDSAIRAELGTFGGVHNFRPIVARAIIDKYCPMGGSVLDPCAGWGGRMFGFYCSNASRYVCIDAEKKTTNGLKNLGKKLDGIISGKSHEVFYEAFEDWNAEEKFDLVFTSPPYFDAEEYGKDEKQSSIRYPEYSIWKHKFLFQLVEKSMLFLKDGGNLVLNIANIKQYPIADELALYLETKYGAVRTHWMKLSSLYGRESRKEPIFVVKKKGQKL